MKLIVIGDIHGGVENIKYVCLLLREIDFDYVMLVGDIGIDYNTLDDYERTLGSQFLKFILKMLSGLDKPIFYVPGNHDYQNMSKYIRIGGVKNVDYLSSNKVFKNNELRIVGIGGSPITPGAWSYEWEDTILALKDELNYEKSVYNILLTHSPPFYSKIDQNVLGQNCGSKRISDLIKNIKFDLLLCGHIHEGQGIDNIDGLLCLNAGRVGMRTNELNLNISNFYLIDTSYDKFIIKKYIIIFESESGDFIYKTEIIKR